MINQSFLAKIIIVKMIKNASFEYHNEYLFSILHLLS